MGRRGQPGQSQQCWGPAGYAGAPGVVGAAAQRGPGQSKDTTVGAEHGVLPPPLVTRNGHCGTIAGPSAHVHSCIHPHARAHTHTRSHPHTHTCLHTPTQVASQEEGKRDRFGPGDPALPHGEKWSVASSPSPSLSPSSSGAGAAGRAGEAGQGWHRGWQPLTPPRNGRGSYKADHPHGTKKEPRGRAPSSAASGLAVYSVVSAFSFIHFRYRQNKNHIFVRQQ